MPSINSPRQVILVTSREEVEVMGKTIPKDNIITVAWHMPVSHDPMLYAVAIGKTRFSAKLIKISKGFVVNFVPKSMEKAAVYCGTHSGDHIDKFEKSGLTKEEAQNIDCPRIKEAMGYLECEVINEIEAGDHIIFLGQVVNAELKRHEKRLFQAHEQGFTTTII